MAAETPGLRPRGRGRPLETAPLGTCPAWWQPESLEACTRNAPRSFSPVGDVLCRPGSHANEPPFKVGSKLDGHPRSLPVTIRSQSRGAQIRMDTGLGPWWTVTHGDGHLEDSLLPTARDGGPRRSRAPSGTARQGVLGDSLSAAWSDSRCCRYGRLTVVLSPLLVMVNVPDAVLEYPYAPQPAGPAGTEAMNGPPA